MIALTAPARDLRTFMSEPTCGLIFDAERRGYGRSRKLRWSVMPEVEPGQYAKHADSTIAACYVPLALRRAARAFFGL